jgi:FtsH-binding integral membrane protein
MVAATSHLHRLGGTGTGTFQVHLVNASPVWAVVLVYVAILGILFAGVWVVARAVRRMSKPARIVVGLVAVWTLVVGVVVFLDAYRPTGDWLGGLVSVAFVVLYGLVAAGIVWVVDATVRRFRAPSVA